MTYDHETWECECCGYQTTGLHLTPSYDPRRPSSYLCGLCRTTIAGKWHDQGLCHYGDASSYNRYGEHLDIVRAICYVGNTILDAVKAGNRADDQHKEIHVDTLRFSCRDLLSVTTHRLLTESNEDGDNGIGNLYQLMGWMTDDSPLVSQLRRFREECEPWLRRWFPELAKADEFLPQLDRAFAKVTPSGFRQQKREHVILAWLTRVQANCGIKDEYDVPRIPREQYDDTRGTYEGVVVVQHEE